MTTGWAGPGGRASARALNLVRRRVPAEKRASARLGEPADRRGGEAPASKCEAAVGRADTPAEIAAELGLAAPLTLGQLGSRWRNFVWRNHPDRQPAHARGRATARVAIANALYDQARRELAKRR